MDWADEKAQPIAQMIWDQSYKGTLVEFVAAALRAERERAAKIAEEHAASLRRDLKSMFGQIAEACAAHCEKVAARIRGEQ